MKLQAPAFAFGLALCTAVGAAEPPPRFDYSTEQSTRESNRAVAEHLPAHQREALAAAIIKLGAAEGAVPYTDIEGQQRVGIPPERIREIVHGKTAEQIIALAAASSAPEVTFDQPAE